MRLVRPAPAATMPSGAATVSSARTTVVPTAITRPPQSCDRVDQPRRLGRDAVALRVRALARLERRHAAVERDRGDQHAVGRRRSVTSSAVNGRPALGISALPGSAREDRLVGGDRPARPRVAVADRVPVAGEVVVDGLAEREPGHREPAAAEVRREQLGAGAAGQLEPRADRRAPGQRSQRRSVAAPQPRRPSRRSPCTTPAVRRQVQLDRLPRRAERAPPRGGSPTCLRRAGRPG